MGNRQVVFGFAFAFLVSLAAPSGAKTWNTTNGNWNTAANWSPAAVPTAGDAIVIVNTDGTVRMVTLDVTTPSLALTSIDLTGAGTAANTLSIPNNFNFTSSGLFVGGYNSFAATTGRGAVTQSAGSVTMNSGFDFVLGYGAGSTGTYTLSKIDALTFGTFTASQSEFIGFNGNGTFTQSGGTNTLNNSGVGTLNLGKFAGSTGTYNLSGGSLLSGVDEIVGDAGTGIFIQSGGTNSLQGSRNLQLGANSATAVGTYTLTGSAALTAPNNIIVGGSGTGTLNIQGTSSVSATNAVNINATSAVNLSGGSLRLNTTNAPNRINFTSGKLQLGGTHALFGDPIIQTVFGSSPVIPANKELAIEGDLTVDIAISVNGGRLTLPNFTQVGFTGVGASFSVANGGAVSIGSRTTIGSNGNLSVSGVGSSFSTYDLRVADGNADGKLTISGGAAVSTQSNVDVGSGAFGTVGKGTVTVSGPGSTLNVGSIFGGVNVGQSGVGIVTIEDQAVVKADYLSIYDKGTVNLNGGTLYIYGFDTTGNGKLNFNSGTIRLGGSQDIGSAGFFSTYYGAPPTLVAGKGLTIDGTAHLTSPVVVNGGTLTAGAITSGNNLVLQRGTLNITSQALTIGSGGQLGSTLDLNDDMTVNATLGTTNQGLVTGDGEIGGTFANAATGELRGEPGKSLKLTGASNVNAGLVNLFGGMVEFTQNLTNSSGAFISGNGTLKVGTLLTNSGTMNFSGLANIVGDVTNNAGAKIIASGGGPTTFFDDVINNGEIRTSAGSFTTFFGAATGGGTYTGAGTVNFEGDLKPGNSPASVNFGGDVVLGVDSIFTVEIGGTTVGSQYDHIDVAGKLSLSGKLKVSLINSFAPAAGQSFDIANWASLGGTFASLDLPALAGGLTWSTSQLYTSGVLSVLSAGIPGDYDNNGSVDVADYLVYRKYAGTTHVLPNDPTGGTIGPTQYATWRSNFGKPPGAGSSSSLGDAGLAAPEPSSVALLAIVGLIAHATRWNAPKSRRSLSLR